MFFGRKTVLSEGNGAHNKETDMTYAAYKLTPAIDGRVPATGEDFGDVLEKLARQRLAEFSAPDSKLDFTHLISTIKLLSLAADAFYDAAKCSLGHSRRDRYCEHADRLRYEVEQLDARVHEYREKYKAQLKENLGL